MVLKLSSILLVCLLAYTIAAPHQQQFQQFPQLLALNQNMHLLLPSTFKLDPLTLTGPIENNPNLPLLFYPSLPLSLSENHAEIRQADMMTIIQQIIQIAMDSGIMPGANFTYFGGNGRGSTFTFDINDRRYYSIAGSPQFIENYLKTSVSPYYRVHNLASIRARSLNNPAAGSNEEILKGVPLIISESNPSASAVQSGHEEKYEPNIEQPGVLAKELADILVEQKNIHAGQTVNQ